MCMHVYVCVCVCVCVCAYVCGGCVVLVVGCVMWGVWGGGGEDSKGGNQISITGGGVELRRKAVMAGIHKAQGAGEQTHTHTHAHTHHHTHTHKLDRKQSWPRPTEAASKLHSGCIPPCYCKLLINKHTHTHIH